MAKKQKQESKYETVVSKPAVGIIKCVYNLGSVYSDYDMYLLSNGASDEKIKRKPIIIVGVELLNADKIKGAINKAAKAAGLDFEAFEKDYQKFERLDFTNTTMSTQLPELMSGLEAKTCNQLIHKLVRVEVVLKQHKQDKKKYRMEFKNLSALDDDLLEIYEGKTGELTPSIWDYNHPDNMKRSVPFDMLNNKVQKRILTNPAWEDTIKPALEAAGINTEVKVYMEGGQEASVDMGEESDLIANFMAEMNAKREASNSEDEEKPTTKKTPAKKKAPAKKVEESDDVPFDTDDDDDDDLV